jgi:hypothetical protein
MPKRRRSPKKLGVTDAGKRERLEARIEALEAELQHSSELAQFYEKLDKDLTHLIRVAKQGDKGAILSLLQVAFSAVDEINDLAIRQLAIMRPIAQNLFVWPALISNKRSFTVENARLLKRLRLGEGGTLSASGWQPYAPSTRLALWLYATAELLKAHSLLPPLTNKTKRLWFNVSWNFVLAQGFKPEEDKLLSVLAKSKAMKKPKYCKSLHPATRAANVRSEIKRRGWKAFDAVVVA